MITLITTLGQEMGVDPETVSEVWELPGNERAGLRVSAAVVLVVMGSAAAVAAEVAAARSREVLIVQLNPAIPQPPPVPFAGPSGGQAGAPVPFAGVKPQEEADKPAASPDNFTI